MQNIKNTITSTNGLQEVLSILLVATILTIFEIIFFYIVVAPGVRTSIESQLDKTTDKLSDEFIKISQDKQADPMLKNLTPSELLVHMQKTLNREDLSEDVLINDNIILNTTKTFRDREEELRNMVNTYTKISGGVLIVILIIALIGIIMTTWKRDESVSKAAIASAIITVLILIGFQYNFYLLGQQYKYTGTLGNEELLKLVIDKLENK